MDDKKKTGTTLSENAQDAGGHSALAKEGLDTANAILARLGILSGESSSDTDDEKIAPAPDSDVLFIDEDEEEIVLEEDEGAFENTDIFEDTQTEDESEEAPQFEEIEPEAELEEAEEAFEQETETDEPEAETEEQSPQADDDSDDDVKIFGSPVTEERAEELFETKTFNAPSNESKTDTRTFGKAQSEVGFSMFEDEEETAQDVADDLEPDDSVDGEQVYVAPNTADDAEPSDNNDEIEYMGEAQSEEAEEASDEEIPEDELSEEDAEEEITDEQEANEGGEKQDALKALFYGSDDDDEDKKDGKKDSKKSKKKPKKVKNPDSGNDFWGKHLGIAEEINMADQKAVSSFTKVLEKKKGSAMISLAGAVLCFLVSMYFELAPVSGILPHPSTLLNSNPAVYVLIDLQIMLFSVMFMFDSLAKGVEMWLDHRIITPAATALTVTAFALVQSIFTVFTSGSEDVRMLCSLGCAALTMLALYDVLGASTALRSFRIAGLSSTKFGAARLSADSREVKAMMDEKDASSVMAVNVCKGKTYKNFVKRTSTLPECEKHLWIPMAAVFAISVFIGFISGVGTKSFYQGFTNAALVYLSSVPLNLFLCSALPEYVAVKRGREINATMVGHNAGNEFRKLSAVTFADTTVFLPKDTRLESQIIVDSERFCDVTLTMVKIFRHIGGPLRYVFDRNLPNPDQEIPADVKLNAVTPTSIEVSVDGKNYVVGTEKHLSSLGLKFTRHDGDERYSLLYLIDNGKVLAKFRVAYKVDARFENTARELDDVHITIGIKTVTPGINDAFLRSLDEFKYCDFTVIRGRGEADLPGVDAETDSGIVALGSVHKFLEMLLICENSVRRTWINSLVKNISAGFCVLIAAWLILFNHSPNLDIAFGLIIQLFWLIPVTLNSYIKK